jgi:Tol biopolymer transport system component
VAATPDGRLVGLPFDLERLEVTGDPIPIASEVTRSRFGTQHFTVDQQGGVYWIPATGLSRADQLVWVDREGRAEPASSHLRHYETPRLVPGGFVAVGVRSAHDDINIWFLDTVRDTLRPVTTGTGYSQEPVWLPGGNEIAYSVPLGNQELPAGLYLRSLDGQAESRLLAPGPLRVPSSISSDGSQLLFTSIGSTTGWDLWRLEIGSESAPEPLLAAPYDQLSAAFAPEPGWIAFEADPSGRHEIYVRRVAEGGPEAQVSPHGGNWPVWNPQGNELFYLSDDSMMSVVVDLSGEPSAEPARPLFPVDGYARTFDVSPDGLRFLMIRLGEEPTGIQVNVTLDWRGGDPK